MRVGRSAVVLACALLAAGCGGEEASDDTMAPIEGAPGDTGGTTTAVPSGPTTTAASPGAPGSTVGFVSVSVQVASAGIDETLALDRATVATLDPLNLNASCTALDGGDPVAVSVIDLRRLGAGSRLLSVGLRTEEPATTPGEHAAQLEIADTQQVTTSFDVTLTTDDGGLSGTFEGQDEEGNVANGFFVCAAQPVEPTPTTQVIDSGEEIPDDTT